MANWKKVIVSGSAAQLSQLSVDTDVNITGSLNAASTVKFTGLTNTSQATIVGIDAATGQLYYQGTGSFTANSASYATTASFASTASYLNPLNQTVSITGSVAITGSGAALYVDTIYAGDAVDGSPDNRIFLQNPGGFGSPGDLVIYSSANDVSIQAQGSSVKIQGGTDPGDGVQITGSLTIQNGASGSFSGSFQGNGSGLTDIPASGIVGLQLNQIASGSATASISPNLGLQVNVPTSINGVLAVTGSITAGNVVSTGANSQLTGSFTGSFAGVASLPPLTQGRGVTTFTYNGSTPESVEISGSLGLSSNTVTKWTGDAFANSSITDGANVTINNAGGVYIQAGGLDVSGSSVFHNNVVMQGNLVVNGTASFQNTTNLEVADQFILLNSGSSTFQDSGIVINTGNSGNSGSAWYLETSGTTVGSPQNGRFAVAAGVLPNATTATPGEYAVTAVISGSVPGAAVPQWGGSNLGQGNMWVDSNTGDIYIYS